MLSIRLFVIGSSAVLLIRFTAELPGLNTFAAVVTVGDALGTALEFM
jgi:hypothetical protein